MFHVGIAVSRISCSDKAEPWLNSGRGEDSLMRQPNPTPGTAAGPFCAESLQQPSLVFGLKQTIWQQCCHNINCQCLKRNQTSLKLPTASWHRDGFSATYTLRFQARALCSTEGDFQASRGKARASPALPSFLSRVGLDCIVP